MKAIILAAGEGTRLRPLTYEKPKCMVELNNIPLLEYQIKILRECGIDDIVVVKGYKNDHIKYSNIKYYINEKYASTNMVRSLFCAEEEIKEDVIISYGDIIYEDTVLKKLIDAEYDISIVIDKGWKKLWNIRFENPLKDAETLKLNKNNEIIEIGQKPKDYSEIQGQYIGLMRFRGKGIDALKNSYHNADEKDKAGKKFWHLDKPLDKAYMTDLLQGLICEGYVLKPVFIKNKWLEIDSYEDYNLFNKLLKEDKLKDIFKFKIEET